MNRREMLSTLTAIVGSGLVKLPVEHPGQVHILEYEGRPGEFIYGLGTIDAQGEIELLGEETFGSFPSGNHPVLRADGSIVSNAVYLAFLDSTAPTEPSV
jgi:hypothetical protein